LFLNDKVKAGTMPFTGVTGTIRA